MTTAMLLHDLSTAVLAALDTALDAGRALAAEVPLEETPNPNQSVKPNLPEPGNVELPDDLNTKLGTLMGWGLRLGYVACFFGFIVAGVKLFQGYRQGGEINFQALGAVAAACLIIGSAGALADMLIF